MQFLVRAKASPPGWRLNLRGHPLQPPTLEQAAMGSISCTLQGIYVQSKQEFHVLDNNQVTIMHEFNLHFNSVW